VRLQSLLVVALALVFGGPAAVGVRSFMKTRGTATKADTVPVVGNIEWAIGRPGRGPCPLGLPTGAVDRRFSRVSIAGIATALPPRRLGRVICSQYADM
jgi:hypothetical protein